jgi:hypothetical protein
MNRVKLMLVCVCLTASLVLPSTATAAKRQFAGPAGAGGTITFKTQVNKKGKNTKVLLPVEISNVPISCDQGDTVLDYEIAKGGPVKNLKIQNKSFSFTTSPSEQPPLAVTTGKFVTRKRATGTFRDSGDFDANHTNCDTGTVTWSASKQ